ncbi:uncharacterized protein METZ01_LOCUS26784 [marine metagenome]|uniref:Uncharacterized protein n=1 Tax=marine metagenome TaxID=408172 RepID=A0A381Q4B9_9ZZZZ
MLMRSSMRPILRCSVVEVLTELSIEQRDRDCSVSVGFLTAALLVRHVLPVRIVFQLAMSFIRSGLFGAAVAPGNLTYWAAATNSVSALPLKVESLVSPSQRFRPAHTGFRHASQQPSQWKQCRVIHTSTWSVSSALTS